LKKVLVTGAGGLVGGDVVEALSNNLKYQVFAAVHNNETDDWQNAIKIDLENTNMESLKVQLDYVVHCAARIPNDIYCDEQAALINRRMDNNIINYCVNHKCKLIYISGTSVYGNDDKRLLTEQTQVDIKKINSKYICEKRNSEIKIENRCDSYCILRISSPYGPRQRNVNVLKKFVTNAYKGENIYYFGTGERTQNFVDVRDVAQAVLKCIDYPQNGIFNIASKNSISMKRLAGLVVEIGKSEFNTVSKVRKGNNLDIQESVRINIDISLAEKLLGWEPRIDLENGIRYWMRNMKESL
jgi:Nucleoside-diphosphate-sugar epimerases